MNKLTFLKRWLRSRGLMIGAICLLYTISLLVPYLFETESSIAFHYLRHLLLSIACLALVIDCLSCYRQTHAIYHWLNQPATALPDLATFSPSNALMAQRIHELALQHEQLQAQLTKQYNDQLDYYTLWAHQIKTPITALYLLVDQLPSEQSVAPIKQELFKIQQYAECVLHYLRMETFHQDLLLQQESLDELVRQTIKKYAPFFISKNIQLILDDCQLDIVTDAKWLAIVLEQLLSNALKYTPKGAIHFYVKERTLFIQDTGIGIRQEDIQRVFERGFTGFNGRMNQQSSGLGLYLCRQITQQLGIRLQLSSELGKGTVAQLIFDECNIVLE
ncbi:sensor histidine kinase [Aerococcaceae bacterium NML180378]|nr:sensor histidine kinase [Aerococcaceae bacterium NML180378]